MIQPLLLRNSIFTNELLDSKKEKITAYSLMKKHNLWPECERMGCCQAHTRWHCFIQGQACIPSHPVHPSSSKFICWKIGP